MFSKLRVFTHYSRKVINFSVTARCSSYQEQHRLSVQEPKKFWGEAAKQIDWTKPFDHVLDETNKIYPNWFKGGQLNMSENCLDRHVREGRGNECAVIYDSPITGNIQKITYSELLKSVELVAGVLARSGIKQGDTVLIYLPMIPQALVAMLACCRIGAIHSLVFGGFAPRELAVRIKHALPKMVISTNVGVEPFRLIDYKKYLDEAITISGHTPRHCLIYNRPGHLKANVIVGRDLDWEQEIYNVDPHPAIPVDSNHPLYLLYTSGTTGAPKGVLRPTGGYAVALKWSMKTLYGIDPGEVWWAASDFGWVVGHSYICYAPLLHGCTTIIYEGKPVGTPDPGQYFRIMNWHRPVSLFVAPTALRAIRREDPHAHHAEKYEYKQFRALFVAGEHCDVETLNWARKKLNVPVLDHWWQTETGWAITCPAVGLESKSELQPPAGSAGRPVPGYDVRVLNTKLGTELAANELGRIVIKLPLPPGNALTLYQADDKFNKTYFEKYPGYYDTMDAGLVLENGHVMVLARDDDVINVAGHRISSGAIEEACLENDNIVECAVIGLNDDLKGQVPLALLVPSTETKISDEELIKDTIQLVRESIGAVASLKTAMVVHRLPKTRSGKVSRGALADMANGKPFKAPVTLEDPTVFDPIFNAFERMGLKPSYPDSK